MAERHGWPVGDFHWHLRREQLRNWQRLYFSRRNARLVAQWEVNEKSVPVSFCPRCGVMQSFEDKDRAMRHEFQPLDHDDIYCGDCDEHFTIRSIPSPYSGEKGWDWRRRVFIAQGFIRRLLSRR